MMFQIKDMNMLGKYVNIENENLNAFFSYPYFIPKGTIK